MQGIKRLLPAGSRLVGILGLALVLCLPQSAAAAQRPQAGTLLARGQGYSLVHGSAQVKALQRRLRVLGEDPGQIDGLFGPRTEAAVRSLQLRSGIAVDGLVGPQTRAALRRSAPRPLSRGAGYDLPNGSRQVRQLQRRLRALGHNPGPIDGLFGPRTEAAVVRLQAGRALAVDGIVGPKTRAALGALGEGEERRAEQSTAGDQASRVERRGSQTDLRRASAAQKVKPSRPAAEPNAKRSADEGKLPLAPFLLGIALLLLAATLLGVRRLTPPWRSEPEASIIPLGRGLQLKGESGDPEIGRFSGTAYAVELPDVQDAEKRAASSRFLVLDSKREHPFWVGYSEVTTPLPPALQAHPGPWEYQANLKAGATVLGYVTVPRDLPERQIALSAQLSRIEELCRRRHLRLAAVVRDVEPEERRSGERPGLAYAIEQLEAEEADALVVCGLERLGHGRTELDQLLARLSRSGAAILALQPELEASPAASRAARRLAAVGSSKRGSTSRSRVAERDPAALRRRIVSMRDRGKTLQAIADTLNDERVPAPRGAPKWRPASVQATLARSRASSPRNVIEMTPPPGLARARPNRGERKGGRTPT